MYLHLVQEENLCFAFEVKVRYSLVSNQKVDFDRPGERSPE